MEARLDHGKVRLLTRKQQDWTHRFKPVAQAVAALPAETALLDGEIVVEDDTRHQQFFAAADRSERRPHRPLRLLRLRSALSRRPRSHRTSRWSSARRRSRSCCKVPGKDADRSATPIISRRRAGHSQARLRDGTRRHRLETAQRALPLRPHRQFHQDQMPRPPGIRRRRLHAVDGGAATRSAR